MTMPEDVDIKGHRRWERSDGPRLASASPTPATVVVMPVESLRALIVDAVRQALDTGSGADVEAAEFLDSVGAAELLSVTPRFIQALAKQGKLPSNRVGRLLRFRRVDLDAWISRTRRGG